MRRTGWLHGFVVLLVLTIVLSLPAFGAQTKKKTGLVKEDGLTHIYKNNGKLVKNVPVYQLKAKGKTGYYSVDKEGNAVKLKGVQQMAAKRLHKLNAGGKKKLKNLKKAFKWSAGLVYRNNTRRLKGEEAAKYYGKYGFSTHSGDCNTAACTFYWMARVLGYAPEVVQGHVPSGSLTNLKAHTWVIIPMSGKTYYFDPDFNRAYAGKTVKTKSGKKKLGKYCGFKFLYGTSGTYMYMD